MDAVLVLAGASLVVATVWDISVTILNPAAPGPFSFRLSRAVWRLFQRLARSFGARRLLAGAGPTTMAVSFVAWLGSLWIGYALVFFAFVERLVSDPAVPFGRLGIEDALYASGISLTTIGFGDVVPASDPLRFVAVLAGASGFGTITAAITYLISVYLVLGRIRADALRLADLRAHDARGAAALVATGGLSEVARIQAQLAQTHEDVRRFPNLFWFHSVAPEESVAALLRAATMLCLVLRWGVSSERVPFADPYGRALEATLIRVLRRYDERFLDDREEAADLAPHEAKASLRALHAAVPAEIRARDAEPSEEFTFFLAHVDAFLNDLLRAELYEEQPLLAEVADEARATQARGAEARSPR